MFDITFVRYESSKRSMHILFWTAPSIWQRTAERQSLPVTGFLRVIYAILNASVILERNEMRLARNEKRLERNKTRLARNETRGGNLLLSGTVSHVFASVVFILEGPISPVHLALLYHPYQFSYHGTINCFSSKEDAEFAFTRVSGCFQLIITDSVVWGNFKGLVSFCLSYSEV